MLAQTERNASKSRRTTSPAVRAYQEAGSYIVSPASCDGQDWQVIKRDGSSYTVDLAGSPRCTCADFSARGRTRVCKHIELVRLHVAADAPAPTLQALMPEASPAPCTFSEAERAALLSLWD